VGEHGAGVSGPATPGETAAASRRLTDPGGMVITDANGRGMAGDLVIGIGNSLRGDDGIGWWLARRAERWLSSTQVMEVQQLTPDLAADLAAAAGVLFIDAWQPPDSSGLASTAGCEDCGPRPGASAGGAQAGGSAALTAGGRPPLNASLAGPLLRRLEPAGLAVAGAGEPLAAFSHQLPPERLLEITELLLGRRPPAWKLLVPGFVWAHGEGFSPAMTHLLPRAERLLLQWIQRRSAATITGRA
jgi:hydrogenase maturation protease